MLRIEALEVVYGDFQVLWGVSLQVRAGEVVCLLGPNGAGKSTIMNATTALVPRHAGRVSFRGEDLAGIPTHGLVARGLAHVLERRRLFPTLTVRQNLLLGGFNPAARAHRSESLVWVESVLPFLVERKDQLAGTLSGGEQQMVAIARGLMARPSLLMIDEPFLGLSPRVIDEILAIVERINRQGVAVLFTEQNVQLALSISKRGYLLESGRILLEGSGREMLEHETVRKVYLGL
ncbi:MAG: ABC transporter ATP-binding protein [Alphaproteobacteria bacterium]|nr:ABC transporter ATP-binding protein [Alphaproteobacteria bacterium]